MRTVLHILDLNMENGHLFNRFFFLMKLKFYATQDAKMLVNF